MAKAWGNPTLAAGRPFIRYSFALPRARRTYRANPRRAMSALYIDSLCTFRRRFPPPSLWAAAYRCADSGGPHDNVKKHTPSNTSAAVAPAGVFISRQLRFYREPSRAAELEHRSGVRPQAPIGAAAISNFHTSNSALAKACGKSNIGRGARHIRPPPAVGAAAIRDYVRFLAPAIGRELGRRESNGLFKPQRP